MNIIFKILTICIIGFLAISAFLYINVFLSVDAGQYPLIVEINNGETLESITDKLYENNLINNKFIFKLFVKVIDKDTAIKVGEYTFKSPLNTVEVANKLISGRYEYIPVIITIKEGEDYRTIVDKIYNNFKKISAEYSRDQLLEILKQKEGYLFPETYNFPPFATLDDIFKKIDSEFVDRTTKYNLTAEELKRILTIASILEKEVPHPEDMKIVSGIIQNRLAKGMPLQMDSTLGYFTGKASLELTTADLQLDSPYNTYKVKGLPSGPIGNPGDVAIDAAINPDKNEFLFFLSDKEGVNHYAKTYAEHLRNRKLYLNK